jgi:wee1-like protein kinase
VAPQDFEELDMLGKGDFGVVHSARSRVDGSLYAVKRGRLQQRTSDKNSAYYEVFAMSSLAGVSNVVRYHSSWEEDDELYIQMELCKHTFLSQCKKGCPLAEQTALEVLHNIGGALCGMHKRGIAHMDVKPDNIYVALDGTYRLGDLGLAASEEQMREGGVEPVEGDGRYAAPEAVMCLSQGGCERLSPCDIYSLGACIFELCTGRAIDWSSQPFSSVREGETVELAGYSAGLCLLLSCMLNPDPAERCTAEEVWKEAGRLVGGGGIEGELARERCAPDATPF